MARKYLGFGHGRLNPEKVSEKAKLFMRTKTSVDKNPSNAVTELLNLPFKVLISIAAIIYSSIITHNAFSRRCPNAHYMMLLVISQKINN